MNLRLRVIRAAIIATAILAAVLTVGADGPLPGQAGGRVDFARDIRPILNARCVSCHGSTEPKGGYRLDRRSSALGGIVRPNVVPRSGESSRLYRRLIGSQFGAQMPPTGPLPDGDIETLKRWIDEGAEWPDELANEDPVLAEDPSARKLTELIRLSETQSVYEELERSPGVANGRGPGGSTPLMYAALYGGAALVSRMLETGADPNMVNNAGATALMWALDDVEKVELLAQGGADVNAVSLFGRTPLSLAAQLGSTAVVTLLLKRGAKANPTALTAAALRGDPAVTRLLLVAGARDSGGAAAAAARRSNCQECLAAILDTTAASPTRTSLLELVAPSGAAIAAPLGDAIARGADVNARDAKSRTITMLAASSDTISPQSVQLLIDHGADLNATDPDGFTALDFARRLGRTPVVDALVAAGAPSGRRVADPPLEFVPRNSVRDAVARSLPLLQRSGRQFYDKSGCVSCHHTALTAMTVAAARRKGFGVDEPTAREQLATVVKDIDSTRDQALQGIVSPGGFVTTTGYTLMGLSAEGHQRSAATDAMVRLLMLTQRPEGFWRIAYRPPFEASAFTATAVSLRGIKLYGGRTGQQAGAEDVSRVATTWLRNTRPQTTEDRVFRLFGLVWAGASTADRQSAIGDLLAIQRADGGWGQLPSLPSDAYATGESLVALHEAGVATSSPAYRRGVQFLLTTQVVDGSWFVRTRAHPTQIYFESGFPHGEHQYISAAATNWATLALVHASTTGTRP